VLGALAIAFSAILVRYSEASPSTAAVFRCAYALAPLYLLARRERRSFGGRPRRARFAAAIAGIFFALDLVAWHHAIESVGAGLATVLGNLQVVLVGLAAWIVLKEKMEVRLIAGVPLALAGVVLISGALGETAYGDNPTRGVIYGVATAIFYTIFILVLRYGRQDMRQPAGPLFDATLAGLIGSLALGVAGGDLDLVPSWPSHGWLIVLALTSQVLGWLLISISLPRLPAALTSVLLTIQPVGSVLLGIALLDEAPSATQLAGVGLVLGGVILAASGRSRAAPVEGSVAPKS
jgi:drug/metabolite transporter (DMT)-like permease